MAPLALSAPWRSAVVLNPPDRSLLAGERSGAVLYRWAYPGAAGHSRRVRVSPRVEQVPGDRKEALIEKRFYETNPNVDKWITP